MTRRATITDLAREAGVSVATVDRVLNGRHRVREATAHKVLEAAAKLGYHATGLIKQRVHAGLPDYRLGFILQKERHQFYQRFGQEIEAAIAAAPGFRGHCRLEYANSQDPGALIERLQHMAQSCQAIAMTGLDYPALTAAAQAVKARGVPVFSLLSDFASGVREGYIGLNNRKAGRTAAWIIDRTTSRSGKVAVIVGSHRFHGHELREIGFRSYFREKAPHFQLLDTLINLETRQVTHEATDALLARHPDLVGLYVAGGGMEGAISALRQAGRREDLSVVVHELTPDSQAALADELLTTVIGTPLRAVCHQTIALMVRAIEQGAAETPGQTFLPMEIHLCETI